jgi:hypothetical protein
MRSTAAWNVLQWRVLALRLPTQWLAFQGGTPLVCGRVAGINPVGNSRVWWWWCFDFGCFFLLLSALLGMAVGWSWLWLVALVSQCMQ